VPSIAPTAAGQSPDAIATGLAQTQAAAPPGVSLAGGFFSDDFSDPTLAQGWSWTREDPAGWNLSERPGWLKLVTSGNVLLGAGGSAPVLLHAAPDGDFEIRSRIEFSPTSDFHFAGVLVYSDDDHFVALGRAFCDVTPACVGDGVYIDNDEAFLAGGSTVIAQGNLPSGAIWLRLLRQGTTYSGFWSSDGDAWTEVGTTTASFTPSSVGLLATTGGSGAAPASALFDLYQVLPPSPVDVQTAGVCQESMASLTFVSNGYLASGWFLVTLGKSGGFESQQYTLLVNGQASECSMLSGRTDRIYCTGPYIPPIGLIPIQLLSADSSCTYETPLQAMSVIPKPQPTSAGTYY
jgi:regulation of enolase protein 1 (concanavalin A-like superfamily)